MLFITVTSSLFAACYFDAFLTKIFCLPIEEQYKYLKVRKLRSKVSGTIKRAKNVCFQQTFFALS